MKITIKQFLSVSISTASIGMLSIGCVPLKKGSDARLDLKGYDSEQLTKFEQERKVVLFPAFNSLSTPAAGSGRLVKMAIFISYDRIDADDVDLNSGNLKDGAKSSPSELDPWSLTEKKDFGAASFVEILRWLVDGNAPFLIVSNPPRHGDSKSATSFSAVVKGRGPSLSILDETSFQEIRAALIRNEAAEEVKLLDALVPTDVLKSAKMNEATYRAVLAKLSSAKDGPIITKLHGMMSMEWEILLHLGVAGTPAFAKAFGEAMAINNIAMLNGHFFADDADAAVSAESNGKNIDRRFRDWSASDSDPDLKDFWVKQESNIYGPAMDAFVQGAKNGAIHEISKELVRPDFGYRVAVFNGCGSEKIEDLVLGKAKEIGPNTIELVGMRGFSNYRHFPTQIQQFLSSLVLGSKWSEVIKSFKFMDETTSEKMTEYLGYSVPGNSSPVFRNANVGADGEAKSIKAAPAPGNDQQPL